MKRVLIVGAEKVGKALLDIFYAYNPMQSIHIFDTQSDAPGIQFAKFHGLPYDTDWDKCLHEISSYHLIINTLHDSAIQKELYDLTNSAHTTFIPVELAAFFHRLLITRDGREKKLKKTYEELWQMKQLLQSIIYSFNDAISVVDENGNGIFINPAYTRLTGLTENEVLGKPASTDIIEGESMHMKVLRTGLPVRGVRLKIGPNKKEVIVNVAPVIVSGELRGSVGIIHDVTEIVLLNNELKRAREKIRSLEDIYTFSDIISHSSEMRLALEQAKVAAKTSATVLLRGMPGTGKELFAKAIHNEGRRKSNPFIRVNCASLSNKTLEKTLFGFVSKDAHENEKVFKGLLEEADKGTILLDGIDQLSLYLQEKIQHVIQNKEVYPVGSEKAVQIDVRMIVTTTKMMEKAIQSNRFSDELYYHINRIPIYIPPLKNRLADIPYLVDHLIKKLNHEYGRNITAVSPEVIQKLCKYDWPGNVRELENTIARAIIDMEATETILKIEHLPSFLLTPTHQTRENKVSKTQSLEAAMEQFEREYVSHVYRANGFNKTKTAKVLNMSVRSLYYKIEKYQIEDK